MDKELSEVLDKIKKCLTLAEGSSNEHEAKSAAMMAQKLLAKYNLQMKDVKDCDAQEIIKIRVPLGNRKLQDKHIRLSSIIAKNYQVEEAYNRYSTSIIFLGYEYNVNIAKEIFLFIDREMENLGNIYLKKQKKAGLIDSASEAKACKKSYIHGFLVGLEENLKEQREELNKYSLVLVTPKEVVEAAQQQFRVVKSAPTRLSNASAYMKGMQDGMEFNIGRNKLENV